jgi:hypothetical protein
VSQPALAATREATAPSDAPKGFAAALSQAVTLEDIEGHTEWTWEPRGFAVQADMGAITGAQASIYQRAKAALDQAPPLLDGLRRLIKTVPPEEQESIRTIVRSEISELVSELAAEDAPRVPRVDTLFTLLLGTTLTIQAERAGGQLGDLRVRFGLTQAYVNTVEDEQNVTNYLVLVDYISCLYRSWQSLRDNFVLIGGEKAPAPRPENCSS